MRLTGGAALVAAVVVMLGASAGCGAAMKSSGAAVGKATKDPSAEASLKLEEARARAVARARLELELWRKSAPPCTAGGFRACKDQCEHWDAASCLVLSEIYRTGRGAEKNEAKMHEYFERGCNLGSPTGACCAVSAAQRAAGVERSRGPSLRFDALWRSCSLRCEAIKRAASWGVSAPSATPSDVDTCIEMADMEDLSERPTSVWRQTPEYRLNLYNKLRPICRVFAFKTACAVANAPEFKKLNAEDDASIQRAIQDKIYVARRLEERQKAEMARQTAAQDAYAKTLREFLSKNQPTNPANSNVERPPSGAASTFPQFSRGQTLTGMWSSSTSGNVIVELSLHYVHPGGSLSELRVTTKSLYYSIVYSLTVIGRFDPSSGALVLEPSRASLKSTSTGRVPSGRVEACLAPFRLTPGVGAELKLEFLGCAREVFMLQRTSTYQRNLVY